MTEEIHRRKILLIIYVIVSIILIGTLVAMGGPQGGPGPDSEEKPPNDTNNNNSSSSNQGPNRPPPKPQIPKEVVIMSSILICSLITFTIWSTNNRSESLQLKEILLIIGSIGFVSFLAALPILLRIGNFGDILEQAIFSQIIGLSLMLIPTAAIGYLVSQLVVREKKYLSEEE